jgi:glutamate racemase
VLGCTEYELAADLITSALPGVALFGSAAAVAAQALRRVAVVANGARETRGTSVPAPGPGTGTLRVLLSGRLSRLPPAALRYPAGRLLAAMPMAAAAPGAPPAGDPAASLAAPGG